jgi:hypothetical protein
MNYLVIAGLALIAIGCSGGSKEDSRQTSRVSVESKGSGEETHGVTSAGQVTEKDFPVPFYPNSKESDGEAFGLDQHDGKKNLNSNRITTDSVQQVVDFYKSKVQGESDNVTPEQGLINGKWPNGDTVVIVIKKEDLGTTIGLGATASK